MHQKEPRTHSTTLGSDNFILISNGSQGAIVRPVCPSLDISIGTSCESANSDIICSLPIWVHIAGQWVQGSLGLARARQSSQATLVKAVSICLIRDILISDLQEVIFVRVLGGCSGCGTHLLHQGSVFCVLAVLILFLLAQRSRYQFCLLPVSLCGCAYVFIHIYILINFSII